MSLNDERWLYTEYVTKDRSCEAIAKELGTYRHKVRRALIKIGIPLKTQSAAQQAALKSERRQHPTKGTKRSDAIKVQISDSVSSHWKDLTPEQVAARAQRAKDQWDAMTPAAAKRFAEAAVAAILKASKEGSKLEKFLYSELTTAGYMIEYHKEEFPVGKLHVDLFLPQLSVAIEVDGPGHFLPIWSQEQLIKTIQSDEKKIGMLLGIGLVIMRVKHFGKPLSKKKQRDVLAAIIKQLEQIKLEFPQWDNRIIDIEVK